MSELNITSENFESLIGSTDKPVLLDFWASWCSPCRMVVPVISEIAEENPQIVVGKINVDEERELASRFAVSSIPTLVHMQNGKIIKQASGARPKADIMAFMGI